MARYNVGVLGDFICQHQLIGGDWGRENELHAHHYRLEAIFAGDHLDRHGYLLDIAVVKPALAGLIDRYRDRTLNLLPEFEGQNPGLEPFARILTEGLARAIGPTRLASLTVKLWEDDEAYASYTLPF